MEEFKFIRTQEDCTTMRRKEYSRRGNPNLYLKPLKATWDLYDDFDAKNTIIIDYLMGKHACNGKGNCIITKTFSYDDLNDTFLSEQLWPCLVSLNGVSDVRPILINMELAS